MELVFSTNLELRTVLTMKVKIDTKEKFHVITVEEKELPANMTEELNEMLLLYMNEEIKNVVLKLGSIESIDEGTAKDIARIQQNFYENNCSFVICELQKPVENFLDDMDLLELLNVVPTESEAWDIVQMEEIEREML